MDKNSRLSEEHGRELGNVHSDFPEIIYRPFVLEKDLFFTALMYWQFCNDVNGEDVSTLKEFDIGSSKVEVTEGEARLYAFLNAGCKIQLAFVKNTPAGFLLYHELFANIISIRSCFVESWASELKLGKGLVNSLQPKPLNLIFQTRKGSPPDKCLKVTESFRNKVAEDDHFYTWSMTWRS